MTTHKLGEVGGHPVVATIQHWTIDTSTLDQSIDPCSRCLREGYGACKETTP